VSVFFTARIGAWAVRHRWLVLSAGVLVFLGSIAVLAGVGANTDVEGGGKGDFGKALALQEERFGTVARAPTELVIFEHPTLTVDDRPYQDAVVGLMSALRRLRAERMTTAGGTDVTTSTRVVASTLAHYDIEAPRDASPFVALREGRGDVTFASVALEGELDASGASTAPAAVEEVDQVTDTVAEWQAEHPEFRILVGGDASQTEQVTRLINEDFGRAALVSTPLTVVIMLLAMGTVLAALVPVLLSYVGIVVTLAVLAIVSQALPLEESYIEVVLLMGLGAGVDYGLFLLTRFRTARREEGMTSQAVFTAWNTAGRNVFIAMTATVIALCGMLFVRDPVFTGLGLGAIVTILLAGAVAMTLLPASTGNALNRLRLPLLGKHPLAGDDSPLNPIAGRIVAVASRWPAAAAAIGGAALIALAVPMLSINLGFNGARSLSDEVEAKAAFVALEENFTLGLSSPIEVVVDAGRNENVFDPRIQQAVADLEAAVAREDEQALRAGRTSLFGSPITTRFNDAGDTEVVGIPVNADIGDDEAISARTALRDDLIPSAFEDAPVEQVLTGGATASVADFKDHVSAKTPITLAFVLLTSFVVLVALYRSLLIGVIAVVLNTLAVGAAYGLLELVFQEGWALEGLLNFEATGIIEAWLPLFVFTITFGISMDYLCFAIGRVKEAHDGGLSTAQSVDEAVRTAAGTVLMAAVVMIAVALTFAFTRFFAIQQFGFTLGAVVFIDATVVLLLLLPASLRLAGERLWYLPSWLEWLPGEGAIERESTATPKPKPTTP
jgi:putative drug exporter of the RND superfamily